LSVPSRGGKLGGAGVRPIPSSHATYGSGAVAAPKAFRNEAGSIRTSAANIRFPRELHGFGEPHHQRIRDIEEIRWIQKYARGIEWEPWERATKDDDEEKEDGEGVE